jgi:hypothetical protein
VTRIILVTENAVSAVRREQYRAFVHPPEAMLEILTERGLRPELVHRTGVWVAEGLVREPVTVEREVMRDGRARHRSREARPDVAPESA